MVYYFEINIVAIVVGILLRLQCRQMTSKNETSQIIMHWMLSTLVLFSASDILAYCFRGVNYWGVELSNICYYLLLAFGSYLWLLYICVKMGTFTNLKRLFICTGIPLALLCFAIICNPWTHFFFSVDELFYYHRGSGVLLTWIVEWGYIIAAFIINIRAVKREQRAYRKKELRGYLIFSVPLAVAAIVQMIFYGTTTNQIGFMIAMLMAFSNRQSHLVQKDELTGLNNRNAFLSYRDHMVSRTKEVQLTLFLMDADNFKTINDAYGHLKGDRALKDIADILRAAGGALTRRRVILYRYGGDEYIIVGTDLSEEDIAFLMNEIEKQLHNMNESNAKRGEQYRLGLSIGHATGKCMDVADFDRLMKEADEAMYAIKKSKKVNRA